MKDLWGQEMRVWSQLEQRLRQVFECYGYQEVRTPVLEFEKLFKRGVGEGSDIVQKEMYSFLESESSDAQRVAMRPEGTAPVVRALIQHKAYQQLPVRWFYMAPMFRKERPQKGRYRQHHQVGFEHFSPAHPDVDLECLFLCFDLLQQAGLTSFEFQINTLGDREDQIHYRNELFKFLSPLKEKLSPDSQIRLDKNPLRILDSKDPADQAAIEQAPTPVDHLSTQSRDYWESLVDKLQPSQIPYRLNPRLVRGLDYYSGVVFEITDLSSRLGSQSSLAGGGRYNHLVHDLGGPELSGFGFGCGLERLMLCLSKEQLQAPPLFDLSLVAVGEEAHALAFRMVHQLRKAGVRVEWEPKQDSTVKNQFKRADRSGAPKTLIIGNEEIKDGILKIKTMNSGEETQLKTKHPLDQIEPTELLQHIVDCVGLKTPNKVC